MKKNQRLLEGESSGIGGDDHKLMKELQMNAYRRTGKEKSAENFVTQQIF
jgi:hypothetical protein